MNWNPIIIGTILAIVVTLAAELIVWRVRKKKPEQLTWEQLRRARDENRFTLTVVTIWLTLVLWKMSPVIDHWGISTGFEALFALWAARLMARVFFLILYGPVAKGEDRSTP